MISWLLSMQAMASTVAIVNATIIPVSSPVQEQSTILFEDGLIVAVGQDVNFQMVRPSLTVPISM